MDRIKKLGGKFLVLALSFMMICSIVQIPVKAADTSTDVEYNITITVEGHGTATSDVLKAKKDRLISLTAVPDYGYIFKGWQSDEVIVTPQNNKFYMPAKDVHLKAVFEAVSANRKATVEDVDITGEVGVRPTKKYFKITLQDDKVRANADFTELKTNLPTGMGLNKSTAGNNTETSFTIVTNGKPLVKGKGILDITIPGDMLESGMDLKVTPNPNAKFNIVGHEATVDDVTVSGMKDFAITTTTMTITADTSINIDVNDDVTSWFTNMPAGLTAKVTDVDDNIVKIEITGTPTATSSEAMQIKIPASAFGGIVDLEVTSNANAKFNINKAEATVDDVTVSGAKDITLAKTTVTIKTNAKITTAEDSTITSWFTNMPNGLKAVLNFRDDKSDGTDLEIYITGKPTVLKDEAMQIKIPASAFGGSEDLEVTSNANAKFDIGERKASMNDIEIKGVVGEAVDKDVTVTLINDELNVGHMDLSKRPTSNLPDGIKLGYGSSSSNQTFKVSVSGTPTAIGNGTIELTIPGEWLKSGKDLKVTANPNAKYDFENVKITAGAGSTHKTGGSDDLTFTCNGSLANLTGIYVDGTLLDPSH